MSGYTVGGQGCDYSIRSSSTRKLTLNDGERVLLTIENGVATAPDLASASEAGKAFVEAVNRHLQTVSLAPSPARSSPE